MSVGVKLSMVSAEKLAGRIAAELMPFCDRIEVVGSLRRRRPVVGDLDFMVMVKPGKLRDFKARAQANAQAIRDGEDVLSVRLKNGVHVEFYLARAAERDLLSRRAGTMGVIMLVRTGSREHNIWVCSQAKRLGLHLNPVFGLFGPKGWRPELPAEVRHSLVAQQHGTAQCLASESEEDIFKMLQLPCPRPEERELVNGRPVWQK